MIMLIGPLLKGESAESSGNDQHSVRFRPARHVILSRDYGHEGALLVQIRPRLSRLGILIQTADRELHQPPTQG